MKPAAPTPRQAAQDVKGVKSVVNNITVMPPAAPVVVNDDGTIRSSVNTIMRLPWRKCRSTKW